MILRDISTFTKEVQQRIQEVLSNVEAARAGAEFTASNFQESLNKSQNDPYRFANLFTELFMEKFDDILPQKYVFEPQYQETQNERRDVSYYILAKVLRLDSEAPITMDAFDIALICNLSTRTYSYSFNDDDGSLFRKKLGAHLLRHNKEFFTMSLNDKYDYLSLVNELTSRVTPPHVFTYYLEMLASLIPIFSDSQEISKDLIHNLFLKFLNSITKDPVWITKFLDLVSKSETFSEQFRIFLLKNGWVYYEIWFETIQNMQFWEFVFKDRIQSEGELKAAREFLYLAYEHNNISLIQLALKIAPRDQINQLLIDSGSNYRMIRIILGYLSTLKTDFKQDPLWLQLKAQINTEEGKKALKDFDATAITRYQTGSMISDEVTVAAIELFELQDKILAKADTNQNFNPLLLTAIVDITTIDVGGLTKKYIENYKENKKITFPADVNDRLKILMYLLVHYKQLSDIPNYEHYINELLTADLYMAIDLKWIQELGGYCTTILQEIKASHETILGCFTLINGILAKLGFESEIFNTKNDMKYHEISWWRIQGLDSAILSRRASPLDAFLAGEILLNYTIVDDTDYFPATGSQSAHDTTLSKRFELAKDILLVLRDGGLLEFPDSKDEQINYLRLFALFSLYQANKDATIFKILFENAAIKGLFENNFNPENNVDNFPRFLYECQNLASTSKDLQYVLSGAAQLNPDQKRNIDVALEEVQRSNNEYVQKAAITLRAVTGRGKMGANSLFISDGGEDIRIGTVALIAYSYATDDFMSGAILGYNDVASVLTRLPEDTPEEIASNTGKKTALRALYEQRHDQAFSYDIYKDVLEDLFSERKKFNRHNICQYIGQADNEAYENSSKPQACSTGCKAMLSTVLRGDMLLGPLLSRREAIEDYLYQEILQQLNQKCANLSPEDKSKLLGSYLSTTAYNAALHAAGKDLEMLNAFTPDEQPQFLGIKSLFEEDLGSSYIHSSYIHIIVKLIKETANNDPLFYDLYGKFSDADEKAIKIMLQIGGGANIIKKLDKHFSLSKQIANPTSEDDVKNIAKYIIGLLDTPDSPSGSTSSSITPQRDTAMATAIQRRKLNNVAEMLVKFKAGIAFDTDHGSSPESLDSAVHDVKNLKQIAAKIVATKGEKDYTELHKAISALKPASQTATSHAKTRLD